MINKLLRDGELNLTKLILNNYSKSNLSCDEVLLLLHLCADAKSEHIKYNLEKISKVMNLESRKIFSLVTDLSAKGLLEIKVLKKERGCVEVIDISKMPEYLLAEDNQEKKNELLNVIANLLGRPLKYAEIQTLSKWIEIEKYDEQAIIDAVAVAAMNNVDNFTYINKVLENKVEDTGNISSFKFEYDWLNDEDK